MQVGSLVIDLRADIARLSSDMSKATKTVDGAVQKIERTVQRAAMAFGGLSAGLGIQQIVKLTDEYTKLSGQLKNATGSQLEFMQAMDNVRRISKIAQTDIGAIGTVYARLTNNLKETGATQAEVSRITETLSLAMKVNGATTTETSSGLLQMSQAFGKGKLDGDEFRTAMETMPTVMRRVAESLGVPFGALKDLAAQGLITGDVLKKSLTDQQYLQLLRLQSAEMRTFGGSLTEVKNSAVVYFGELNKSQGAVKTFADGISFLADNFDALATIVGAGVVIALGKMTNASVAGISASMARRQELLKETIILERKVAAENAAALATANNARAVTFAARRNSSALNESIAVQKELATRSGLAATAMRGIGGVMNFLGGPIGIAITGFTALAFALQKFADDAEKKAFPALEQIKQRVEEINAALKNGVDKDSPYLAELNNIKDLEIQRDSYFKKLRAQQQSMAGTDGSGGWLSASAKDVQQTAIEYLATVEKLNQARKALTEQQKATGSASTKDFYEFTKSVKLNSVAIQEQIAIQEKAVQFLNAGTLKQADYNAIIATTSKQIAALTGETEKEKATTKATKEAVQELTAAERDKGAVFKDIVAYQIQYNEQLQAYQDGLQAPVGAIGELISAQQEQNAELQRQLDIYNMGEGAVNSLELARLRETAAAYDQNAAWAKQNGVAPANIKAIEDMAEAYRVLADDRERAFGLDTSLENIKKERDAVKQTADDARREYERLETTLTQSITDALFRGFENGKGFLENFKDTLINAFKTLILRPQIDFLVKGSGLAGLFGSGAAFGETAGIPSSGGGFSFSGLLSTGKSLFQGITNGFNSLNSTIIESIQGLSGDLISNGFDKLGGFMFENSNLIANGLAYIPAAFSLLQGDFKSAAFQGAGAAIGTAFGGPIGGAIGSFIGGAVGGLFGSDDVKRAGTDVRGVYRNGAYSTTSAQGMGDYQSSLKSPLASLNQQFSGRLGTLLSAFGLSDTVKPRSYLNQKNHSHYGFGASFAGGSVWESAEFGKDLKKAYEHMVKQALGPLLIQAIQKSTLPGGIKSLFGGVSGQEQVANLIQATLNLNSAQKELADRFGLTVDAAGKVSRATGLTGDALIEFVNKLAGSALAFKSQSEILIEVRNSLIEGIGSLPADINAFDAILKALDTTTSAGIAEFQRLFALRDQFGQFTAAIDTLKNGVNGAVFGLLSPSQQLAKMQEDLQTVFGNLGLSVPNSIQELIALGNSIDYTTESGLDLAAAFPALVQAFMNTKNGVDSLATSLNELDPDRFKTLVDYRRAQAYARNGISLDMLPSYDVGTAYVPQDGPAMIHQGERILTRTENGELMRRLSNKDDGMRVLAEEVRGLREENRSMRDQLGKIADNTKRSKDVLEGSVNGSTSLKTRTA